MEKGETNSWSYWGKGWWSLGWCPLESGGQDIPVYLPVAPDSLLLSVLPPCQTPSLGPILFNAPVLSATELSGRDISICSVQGETWCLMHSHHWSIGSLGDFITEA